MFSCEFCKKKLLDALSSGTALDFPKIVSIAICSNSPVLNGRLTFGEDNSRHHVSSWNLPFFWDNPGVNVRYLLNFQVDHTFYKLDVKSLATRNKSRCVRCSSPPSSSWARSVSTKALVLTLANEAPGISLGINKVCSF